MSHGDTILTFLMIVLLAKSGSIDNAAYEMPALQTYCLQFHPEVYHQSTEGSTILQNFLVNICGCAGDWTEQSYIDTTVGDQSRRRY